MRIGTIAALLTLVVGCGSRTELGAPEDFDGSTEDAGEDAADGSSNDGTVIDVGIDVEDAPTTDDSPTEDAPTEDAGIDAEPVCTSDCTSNHECATTCPHLEHGRYCCDEPTGMCYAIPGHHCPSSIVDAGFD